MTNISISKEDFFKLSTASQTEILNLFTTKNIGSDSEECLGELTKIQVNKIIKGLSEKSRDVLKAAASFGNNNILFDDLLDNLGVEADDIKGVWSGITTRCRNVTDDRSFLLIDWVLDEDDQVYTMKFHPNTYAHIVSYFQ